MHSSSLSLTFSLSHTHPSIALSHSNSLIISIPFALSLSLMHLVLIDEPVLNRLHLICLSIHLCFYEYSYPSILSIYHNLFIFVLIYLYVLSGSHGIAPTWDGIFFLKIGFVLAGGVFYSIITYNVLD